MLKQKIKNNQNGILLYGLTPPKSEYSDEKIAQIAKKQIDRINTLDIDGIILYDIQDESARTNQKRPFPFLQTVEPYYYATNFLHVNKPKIIYKAIGKYSKDEINSWLKSDKLDFLVFVGVASKNQQMQTTMDEAYRIKKEINDALTLGGIAIPERHHVKKDEHKRVSSKIEQGCEFFVTQALYDKEKAKQFLDDLSNSKIEVPIIFTLTPCGSIKTLEFMKWLGISVPNDLENELRNSHEILSQSIKMCKENFEFIYNYGKKLGISVGCNVESVAVKKDEIEASLKLIKEIKNIMNS